MDISIIGTGYVGLVTGACFAELGNKVHCIDNDKAKINALKKGSIPIYEPGLEELVDKNIKRRRLSFTSSISNGIEKSVVIFIAVGTPSRENGEADLTGIENVARSIAMNMKEYKLIVEKSTVPVETGLWVQRTIQANIKRKIKFDVASNPEFLREGSAISDFMHPDRIVIGVESTKARDILLDLYRPLNATIVVTDIKSAELIKQRSEESVYQQSEGIAKVAQQGLKGIETYLSDIPYIGDIAKVLFKSQIPYVKTPLNILGETMQYTFPEYTAAKGSYYALKGDRRQAVDYFGKAVTGAAIRYGVNQLIQNSLVTGSSDRKDVEGAAIQYQNVPPNSLNISGLQRMMSGGNPAIKDKDVWVDYKNMGVVGLLIGVHANQKELKPSEQGYLGELFGMVSYTGQAAIEQSFLQGANTFLEAVTGDDKSKRKWAINTLGALGSIVYPNTLANISKAEDNTSRVTKADSFYDELVNTFKTKMFSGGSLPTKVNLWGESIKGAPEGSGKYSWYLLNVTKGRNVDTESFNYKIYDLWKSAEDPKDKSAVLPSIPRDYLVIKKVNVKLPPTQYETYQKYVGKNRANLVEKYTKSPNWNTDSLEEKIDKLKKLYASGAANAKKQMLFENPELKKKP